MGTGCDMNEPREFWVRQISSDGKEIAVKIMNGTSTDEATVKATLPQHMKDKIDCENA